MKPAGDDRRALMAALMQQGRPPTGAAGDAIAVRATDEPVPLSFSQQRLWFLDRLSPQSPFYNTAQALRLRGPLDAVVLESAFRLIVGRHEALRTRFVQTDDGAVQVVAHELPVWLERLDLESGAGDDERLGEAIRRETRRPFGLEAGPLFRFVLFRLAPSEHVLLICFHHIVADSWSIGVLFDELSTCYGALRAGDVPELPTLRVQYPDFAAWQRRFAESPAFARQLGYWKQALRGARELAFPLDRPRPAQPTFEGRLHPLRLDAELTAWVMRFSHAARVTPFMSLFAALAAILSRYALQADVVIGSPIAGRTRADTAGLLGFFVNELVLRADLDGDPSFAELVEQVRRTTLDAYENQDVPFERIVDELHPERDLARNPFFQVAFAYHNTPRPPLRLGELEVTRIEVDTHAARFDMEFHLWQVDSGELEGRIVYATDVLEGASVARLADHFIGLLRAALRDPARRLSTLPLGAAAVRTGPALAVPEQCLHDLFTAQARRTPAATAVRDAQGGLSYAELDARAIRLATALAGRGIGPGRYVGIALRAGIESTVAMLGVLKAGAAYVPIDPDYPAERIAHITSDARLDLVLHDLTSLEQGPETAPASVVTPADAAYVLYTSGSTGLPKGVVVEHRQVVASTLARLAYYSRPVETFLLLSSLSFDSSVAGIYWTLCTGGTLLFVDEEVRHDPVLIGEIIRRAVVTHTLTVPSLYRALLADAAAQLGSLKVAIVAGEPCPTALVAEHAAALPGTALYNEYGPTEAAVWATVHRCDAATDRLRVPIGAPIPGTYLRVLDAAGGLVADGLPGQLYVGGAGVARGYLHRPELTAARFVADRWASDPRARLYATGDLVRVLPSGELAFLGRTDDQLKLRGHRIEPSEIELVLSANPFVADAIVELVAGPAGDELAAFVTRAQPARDDALPDGSEDEHVGQWRGVYDALYARPHDADPAFDFAGWVDSLGEPIPAPAMREWVDLSAEQLRSAGARRVLEVGCGNGLLLLRIAPLVELYVGTDFSQAAIERIAGPSAALPQVRLERRAADEIAGLAGAPFDLIVINSVVQYFPGIAYLRRVLRAAAALLTPGGSIFVGDVRNPRTARHLYAGIAARKGYAGEQARQFAEQAAHSDEELLVDPSFFVAAAAELGFGGVRLLTKAAAHDTELTRYRYDVWLEREAAAGPRPHASPYEAGALDELERLAGEHGEVIVTGIPDARLEPAQRAALHPHELSLRARQCGLRAAIGPADEDGRFDALFARGRCSAHVAHAFRLAATAVPRWERYGSDPASARFRREAGARLRGELAARLPSYMIPAHVVVLESFPRSPNGKIDRRALRAYDPVAGCAARSPRAPYAEPTTALERRLAHLWSSVLGITPVGLDDSFFDLGGNSLQAVTLASRMSKLAGRRIAVSSIFLHPTIAGLMADPAAGVSPPVQPLPPEGGAVRSASRPLLELVAEGRLDRPQAVVVQYADRTIYECLAGKALLSGIWRIGERGLGVITAPILAEDVFDRALLGPALAAACALAREIGATVLALAGDLAAASDLGRLLDDGGSPRVGIGHATTAASIVMTVEDVLARTQRRFAAESVLLIGGGPLGQAALDVLIELHGAPRELRKLDPFASDEARAILRAARHPAVAAATLVLGCSSAPSVLDPRGLSPGTIVVDDALPRSLDLRLANSCTEAGTILCLDAGWLRAAAPIARVRYDPAGARSIPALDERVLTSCALSAVIASTASHAGILRGPVRAEHVRAEYALLRAAGFDGGAQIYGDVRVADERIDRFTPACN